MRNVDVRPVVIVLGSALSALGAALFFSAAWHRWAALRAAAESGAGSSGPPVALLVAAGIITLVPAVLLPAVARRRNRPEH